MIRRSPFLFFALGVMACGSILHLGDYEVVGNDAPDGSTNGTREAGGPVSLDGGITISTTSLAFADGKCGEKKTLPIVVTNRSSAPVPLSLTAPEGITIDGSSSNVPANGSLNLIIGTTGVDQGTITLKLGDQSFDVSFTGKFTGPRLAIDTSTVDFGEIRHDLKSDPRMVNLENSGDEDVTVTGVSAGTDFALDGPVNVPAHGKATASFTMSAGPGGDSITASAPLITDKPVCDSLPALVFKGRRSATDVTVSRTSVDVPCVNSGAAPAVVVSNFGAQNVKIDAKTQPPLNVNPSSTQIFGDTSGVPTTATFTVNFGTQTLGDYSYDLVITEGALAPRTVTVKVHLYGAKLEYATTPLEIDAGTTGVRPAKNTGNAAVCIHYGLGGADPADVSVEPDETFVPNVDGDIKVTSLRVSGAERHGRVKPQAIPCSGATAAAPVCGSLQDLPFDILR